MTDEEWEQHRNRAIMAAFNTGRVVFADTDGKLQYYDDKGGDVDPTLPLPKAEPVKLSWWERIKSWVA